MHLKVGKVEDPREKGSAGGDSGLSGAGLSGVGAEALAGEDQPVEAHGMVGSCANFLRVTKKIPLLAESDATVLITGETGTGKELFAHAIHNYSPRRDQAFIPVNCGALPEDLIENELFGHAKGAYTGAGSNGRGLLAEAEGGTLFLDELNSLSASAQAKMLRFLQNREYRMLGSTKLLRANVRIIAATNCDLRKQVQLHRFREDLYHRLYVLAVDLPPLRERVQDIELLARHFLSRYAAEHGKGTVTLSSEAIERLKAYPWAGNVRELDSVMQRSLLLAPTSVLGPWDIDLPELDGDREETYEVVPDELPREGETFREAKERVIRQFERAYLSEILVLTHGNVTHAAKIAGMQRRDFQRLLRKHDLRAGQPQEAQEA